MESRRIFIKKIIAGTAAMQLPFLASSFSDFEGSLFIEDYPIKISLAQWSIHRSLDKGTLKAENFASIAKNDFGISAVEYVATYYKNYSTNERFWQSMKQTSDNLGVKSLLIMVDNEGDIGNLNKAERMTAVENHYKWINAAKILGCHSIRLNAFGDGDKKAVQDAVAESMTALCTYAAKEKINVIIENHGLYSADGQWIEGVMKKVNMPNCGTLPDFGNWCTNVKWGSTEKAKNCTESYDRYKGVKEFLPFAKGVSAKSYEFDSSGEETVIDYTKMLKLVKDSGFKGYLGIEYEGNGLSEPDGICATKALIEKTLKKVWG